MITATIITCLALNIYHEARGEPIEGQQAVALVTLNRANVLNEPVCKVVYAKNQFSWTIYKPSVTNPQAYQQAKSVAKDVLAGKIYDFTHGSTYYHSTNVSPSWRKKFIYRKTIGKHKFYFTLEKPVGIES